MRHTNKDKTAEIQKIVLDFSIVLDYNGYTRLEKRRRRGSSKRWVGGIRREPDMVEAEGKSFTRRKFR